MFDRARLTEALDAYDEAIKRVPGITWGVNTDATIEAARLLSTGKTVMMCPVHVSPWYEDEGMCQRAAAAHAWKEDDTMWQDCGDVVEAVIVLPETSG